ncbi:HAD family hydrolase [Peribacillus acanthi]|uniref:HAD family hydrolase n=1 Tax=Peribacillus acanthi TaxID=2171554 RepID=UPI000D3ECA68|nr:HAD family hydrolase [Peribacillus acanthi]
MIKALVFDFDGLIIDTESVWYDSYREVLSGYGMDLKIEDFSKVIGTTDEVLYQHIRENVETKIDRDTIEKETHEIYKIKMGEPVLREGVEDYLKAAKEKGIRIALASSSSRQWVEGYIRQLGIIEYFEVIKTRDDVSKVKPDPELYMKAVEALGIESSEALAFEDSLNGLMAARKAGLHCAIVPNPVTSNLEFEDYQVRISSMGEMTLDALLDKISDK